MSIDTDIPSGDPPATLVDGDIRFEGRAGEIAGLVIKNFLLNILTLGFWRFWARTRVRRYLWQKMHVLGSPLEYTGTGKELFVGFLLIVFIVFLPFGILNAVLESMGLLQNPEIATWFSAGSYLMLFYLIGVATWRARRYRLTRTRWRSIRAGLTGSSWAYGAWYLLFTLGKALLGLLTPLQNMTLWRLEMQNTHIGNSFVVFDKDNKSREVLIRLYRNYFLTGLLAILIIFVPLIYIYTIMGPDMLDASLTKAQLDERLALHISAHEEFIVALPWMVPLAVIFLIVAMSWYKLRETRLLMSLTTFENLTLTFEASLPRFLILYVGNLAITLLTLGIGLPFAQLRYARFVATHLQVDGELDLAGITQSADDDLTNGEGLADAFDMGAV